MSSDGIDAFFRDCPAGTSGVEDLLQVFIQKQLDSSGKHAN
jgi:hypothetical protein